MTEVHWRLLWAVGHGLPAFRGSQILAGIWLGVTYRSVSALVRRFAVC